MRYSCTTELGVLTIEDLEEAFAGIERTRTLFASVLMRCPFYGCKDTMIRDHLEHLSDFCPQCSVIDDCKEMAFGPEIIDQITDLALLPPYLTSKFELIRMLAEYRLAELLQGEIAMEVQGYPYYQEPRKSERLCACGCGSLADYGSKFQRGHGVKKRRKRFQQMHHRRRGKS